jgi:Fur family ferric uptake transcriptional regulator
MTHCHTIIHTLRERGHRITPQREMIICVLGESGRHMTADAILEAVQAQTAAISAATIYRTLDFLFEQGLVTRCTGSEGETIYATLRHGPHIHLICRRCGHEIEDEGYTIAPLGEYCQDRYGFTLDQQHIALFGVCAGCQEREEEQ